MSTDKRYAEAVDGIALARETIRQVCAAIRQGMDQGDDPVIILHNMAGSMAKEASFQAGGKGSAVFVVACFLLTESGFFDEKEPVCVCPGYSEGTYLETCRVHGGSWAETLAIMADPQAMAALEEAKAAGPEDFVEVGAPYCNGYCAEVPSGVSQHDPRCSEYREEQESGSPQEPMERRYSLPLGACTDPDCFTAGCDGDHEPRRCPTTDVKRGDVDTVDGRWVCCGGLYPTHIHADPFAAATEAMVAEEFESWDREQRGEGSE